MKLGDRHYRLSWEEMRSRPELTSLLMKYDAHVHSIHRCIFPPLPLPRQAYVQRVTLPCGLQGEFVCWMNKQEVKQIRKRDKLVKKSGQHEDPYFRGRPTIMFMHGGGFCIGERSTVFGLACQD